MGPAWDRFERWLEDAGFSEADIRRHFLRTAIVKCFPAALGGPAGRKRGDRAPVKGEIESCRHFLAEQIRLLDPAVLVPMGALPLGWFFPRRSLDDVVGQKLSWQGRSVVPFPHASGASTWWKQHKDRLDAAKAVLGALRRDAIASGALR